MNKIRELSDKLFDGLPPFTIAIDTPTDARLLSWAIMCQFCDNDTKATQVAFQMLIISCETAGVERGVDMWIEAAREASEATNSMRLPKWMRPMMIHIMTHLNGKINK